MSGGGSGTSSQSRRKRRRGPIPFRDPERPGGWVSWRERLLPLLAIPGEPVEFVLGTGGAARTTASHLRRGYKPIPPGRWEFKVCGNRLKVRFLGPVLTGD